MVTKLSRVGLVEKEKQAQEQEGNRGFYCQKKITSDSPCDLLVSAHCTEAWSNDCPLYVYTAGSAASPAQHETDTKPFHWPKEPQERRGQSAKQEADKITCLTHRWR